MRPGIAEPDPRTAGAAQLGAALRQRPLLILAFSGPPDVGGVETFVGSLASAAAAAGIAATVLTFVPHEPGVPVVRHDRVGTLEFRRVGFAGQTWFYRRVGSAAAGGLALKGIFLWPGLAAWLWRHPHGVIHAVGFHMAGLTAAAGAGERTVVTTHHSAHAFSPIAERFVSWSLRRASRVLSLSDRSLAQVRQLGVPAARTARYRQWYDLELFQPRSREPARAQLGLDPARRVVLTAGRLVPEKGLRFLPDLARQLPEATFIALGRGPLGGWLAEQGVSNLRVVPAVEPADMPTWYAAADVVLVPSVFADAHPRVAVEAGACGRPVVASNLGGLPEAVAPAGGALVEPTLAALASGLRSYLGDPGRARSAGAAARAHALRHHGLDQIATLAEAYAGVPD